ncbi:HWE histidine kinase domain-containing protein [Thalassorhabdomicrobium marinisediminis]|uniref:HWE histidine kinase domain-containing protein n=1 Tax=Thalassorhabdomicrobium marinisediminis TaxID=2170577 RepID=UPI002490E903|nr:HWE histidine kinase domain-containing protein [Thalassorhabdomicrobium marinisediminis]
MTDTNQTARDPATARALNDTARLSALEGAGVLDTEQEEAFDRATRLATQIIGTPVSLLSFVDDTRQFFKSQQGLTGWAAEQRGTPLSHSFCQHVVDTDAPLRVRDARNDPLVRDNMAIEDLNVIAYLGVPVHASNGAVLGSFCAIDNQPRDWTEAELASLHDLAAMVETELSLRETAREREVVVHELNHRVKNLFTLVGGMIRMESRGHDEVDAFAKSLDGRLRALNDAHGLILPVVQSGRGGKTGADLAALTEKLLAPYSGATSGQLSIVGPQVTLRADAAVPLTLALHEMVTNAVKYGGLSAKASRLAITWHVTNEALQLDWEEHGVSEADRSDETSGFGSRLLTMTIERQLGGERAAELDAGTYAQRITLPRTVLED